MDLPVPDCRKGDHRHVEGIKKCPTLNDVISQNTGTKNEDNHAGNLEKFSGGGCHRRNVFCELKEIREKSR